MEPDRCKHGVNFPHECKDCQELCVNCPDKMEGCSATCTKHLPELIRPSQGQSFEEYWERRIHPDCIVCNKTSHDEECKNCATRHYQNEAFQAGQQPHNHSELIRGWRERAEKLRTHNHPVERAAAGYVERCISELEADQGQQSCQCEELRAEGVDYE